MATIAPIFNDPLYTGVNESISTKKRSELGKDAFLNLLITQLKNQDPLNPMKDQEFIAQLATFSNLEQLTNLNKSMGGLLEHQEFQMKQQKLAMAVSMIGKEVVSTDGKRGIVNSVVMDGEDISLKVGKDSILLSKIREISK